MFSSPASRGFLGKPVVKPPSEEEKAKKAAEEERKKKAEALIAHQEKLDSIAKLEAEMNEARLKAVQASPMMFSPHLNLPPDGIYGLASRGGLPLLDAQRRMQEWLLANNPEVVAMSEERKHLVAKIQQMDEYMRSIALQNEQLREENVHLTRTIRQQLREFGDPYDDDGADPEWEEVRRRRRRPPVPGSRRPRDRYDDRQYGEGREYYPPNHYTYDAPSPGFSRAREAERSERERFFGRTPRW